MQLAKTLAALERLRDAGVPFISVLSDPTTGGVFASFAARRRRQRRRAERAHRVRRARGSPRARSRRSCRTGFQRAEFLFATGSSTASSPRPDLRDEVARLLAASCASARHGLGRGDERLRERQCATHGDWRSCRLPAAVVPRRSLAGPRSRSRRRTTASPSAAHRGRRRGRRPRDAVWARVQLARNLSARGPSSSSQAMTDEFIELHGDRLFGDDAAMVGGLAPARRPADRRRSASRRAPTPTRTSGATSGCRTPRATARRCGSWSSPSGSGLPVVTFVDVPGRASRARIRGARHRRGDRPLDRADEPAADADRDGHHRRGRLRRRARDRRRRRRHRPRERGLLGDQPGGLRRRSCGGPPTRRRPRPWRCG